MRSRSGIGDYFVVDWNKRHEDLATHVMNAAMAIKKLRGRARRLCAGDPHKTDGNRDQKFGDLLSEYIRRRRIPYGRGFSDECSLLTRWFAQLFLAGLSVQRLYQDLNAAVLKLWS
jgi:hypothetical protein